jgi:hypothetical protein
MSQRILKPWLVRFALATSATLAGCVTSVPPPTNPPLQGAWRLDPSAGDDATARIASAIRAARERLQKLRRREQAADDSAFGPLPDAQGADVGELGVGGGPIAPDFQTLRDRLQQEVGSPRMLSLKVQSEDLLIQGDGLPARDYQLGSTDTRFDEYGTAQIRASWKDNAFEISARYTSGARLEERYAVNAQGALEYTRSLRDPTIGKLDLRSVYRRTAP